MKISIVGTGYVGLVTGACFAEVGNHVLCVDNDQSKIDQLESGKVPIFEPGLEEMVANNAQNGRLNFTTKIEQAIKHSEILFIAVGTPPDEDGSADLSHVLDVAHSIGQHMTEYRVLVTKSTVPVGTAKKVRDAVQQELETRGVEIEFGVVSNPEFLKEGAAIEDFMRPDRVIIGADDDHAIALMRKLYAPFNRNHDKLIVMDVASSELTKYAANAMLATKISFMNELSNVAELLGADIELVRQGIGSDPRIGYHFIYPGCGYGGSCFPKDVKALHFTARQNGFDTRLLDAVESVNEKQKRVILNKIKTHFGDDLRGKTIAIWGLAFKPNTDDMREAPSRVIMEGLWQAGVKVQAYDPVAKQETAQIYSEEDQLTLVDDLYSALEGADALAVITEWQEFRSPDFSKIKQALSTPVIFDGRNIYDVEAMNGRGFDYYSIGRKSSIR